MKNKEVVQIEKDTEKIKITRQKKKINERKKREVEGELDEKPQKKKTVMGTAESLTGGSFKKI